MPNLVAYAQLQMSSNVGAVTRSVMSHFGQLRKENNALGASFRSMAIDGAKGVAFLWAASKAASATAAQVKKAAELREIQIDLTYELKEKGKGVEQLKKEVAALERRAFKVQALTPFDMAQIQELQRVGRKSGASVEALSSEGGATSAAAILATVEKMDPAETMKRMITIGTPFNIAANDFLLGLADPLKRFSSSAPVEVDEVSEAFKFSAGLAADIGSTIKDELAVISSLAFGGYKGTLAGTARRQFLANILDPTKEQSKMMQNYNLDFYKDGKLKPTMEIASMMREAFGDMDPAERGQELSKMFNIRSLPVALAYLREGEKSLERLFENAAKKAPLMELISDQFEGLTKNVVAFQGTAKSTWAVAFKPAESWLAGIMQNANAGAGAIGDYFSASPNASKAVSGLAVGGTAALGTAGTYFLSKALMSGFKGLFLQGGFKRLFGAGGVITGVMQGKALKAVTGTQDVFVVNWPTQFGGAGVGSRAAGAVEVAAGTAAAQKVSQGAITAGLIRYGSKLLPHALLAAGVEGTNYLYESTRDKKGSKTADFTNSLLPQAYMQMAGAKMQEWMAKTPEDKKLYATLADERYREISQGRSKLAYGPNLPDDPEQAQKMQAAIFAAMRDANNIRKPDTVKIVIDGATYETPMDGRTQRHLIRRHGGGSSEYE